MDFIGSIFERTLTAIIGSPVMLTLLGLLVIGVLALAVANSRRA